MIFLLKLLNAFIWKNKQEKGAKNKNNFNMYGKAITIRVSPDYAVSKDNADILLKI